jgi:drug/metabolite transporter (DMT)-like permease
VAHLTFMLLVFAPRYRTGMVAVPSTRRHAMRSLLMLGMPLCFIWGTDRMPVELVLAVFWVTPLLLVLFAMVRATERFTWHVPVAAIAGWIGVLFVFHPAPPVHLRALVLPLGMAVCFALYIVMTREMRAEPILPKMFHTAFWVCTVLTLCLPLFWKTPTLHGAIVIASIGVVGWFALLFLDRAADTAPAAVVGPVLFSNVIWAEVIHWAVRGTRPAGFAILGTAIVAAAVLLGLQARWTAAE